MDYGKILTRSWEVFWKHKVLWIFGLLSGALKGLSISALVPNPSISPGSIELFQATDSHSLLIRGIGLLASLLSLLLGAFATAGIIQGNLQAEVGREVFTFKEISNAIKPFFWRVLGTNAVLGLVVLGGELLALASVIMFFGMQWLIPIICILAPVLWFFSIVLPQAPVTIISEELNIIDSIKRAWHLVTRRIILYLGVWLVGMVIIFGVSSVISVFSSIGAAPISPLESTFDYLLDPATMPEPVEENVLLEAIWDRVDRLLMGVVGVFTTSMWVQTYLEVRRKEAADFATSDFGSVN